MTADMVSEGTLLGRIWDGLRGERRGFFAADIDKQLSHEEFLTLALRYAAAVRGNSAFGPHAVPVLVGRRVEAMAAILGVLLAGRAFAPLSISQPAARLSSCLEALGATAALAGYTGAEEFSHSPCAVIAPAQHPLPVAEISVAGQGDALLYILFTSGSTGIPKGVMCSHDNILNTLLWSLDFISWGNDDCIGVATQFSFDISMFDFFSALYFSVPICVFDQPSDVKSCLQLIDRYGITSIFSVPFFFSQFVRGKMLPACEVSSLRRILSGGDFFPPAHMLAWLEMTPSIQVLNVWGPTETSIVNTMHVVDAADLALLRDGKTVAVGQSHPRMEICLLDPESSDPILSDSVEGEVAMLGRCVSLGYLDNPQLTATQYFMLGSQRGFRTGDIGRLQDGKLYIQGRTGSLVKVSGFRIDLNEVERALSQSNQVFLAAAFVHATVPGVNEIWCCVQPAADTAAIDIFALKRELRGRLPAYMVPKRILSMENLPLNANGKVDRRAAKTAMVAQ